MRRWIKMGIVLTSLMFMCSNIFADIPNGTVVIGNKGYDLKYANKKENEKLIRKAIMDMDKADKIYIKGFNGTWYANNGEKVSNSVIPVVDYNSENGEVITYESGDREAFVEEAFKVINVSFLDSEHIEIIFSENIKEGINSEDIKLSGYLDVKNARAEGRRIIATLNDKMRAKAFEGTITISADIENVHGESLGEEIQERIYVINKGELSDRTFDKNVSIISHGFKGENLTFNRELTISGNNVTLKNSKVDKLSLNPGETGNVTLDGVMAEKMHVFSGGVQGIGIKNCNVTELQVRSNTNTRIYDLDESNVKSTVIQSNAILESQNGTFENITLLSSIQEKKVELIGKFKKITAENNSFVVTSEKSEVEELIVKGHTKVEGKFSIIDVQNGEAGIEISGGTKIKKFKVKANNLVKVLGSVRIEDMEGPSAKILEVNEAVEDAKFKDEYPIYSINEIRMKVQDIQLDMDIINNPFKYNEVKYKKASMSIDFSNLELSVAEMYFGMTILIYDENNNIINAIQQKVKDNKIEVDKLFVRYGKTAKVVLYTEQKGIIEFVFKP